MGRKLQLILVLILVFGAAVLSSFYLFPLPSLEKNSTATTYSRVVLGETEYGTVTREGPYGNPRSPYKIAYVVGVHPLEYQAHLALKEALKNRNHTLNYCYYIYQVNVTQNADNYDQGRANGQSLAFNYVVPDIKNSSPDLVIDVHSNEGHYQEKWFLFVPGQFSRAESIAQQIKSHVSWLKVYSPPNPTSPAYVTLPLIQAGIPSMIYETYTYQSQNQTQKQANEMVSVVDQLKLS
ncbi:hypothetical protein [Methanobacterium formicicum]|uniref:Stage II sporulation protein P n=1 Tax=Methanobacterium formicicum TaxID=2162 RepID=A0A0S4FRH5_METFO|nr:hypothetical protein [Methanobacterium formicicum]CEL25696.1 hypothetical protein MB9_2074 [Methanobacterium formicicum]